MNNDNLQELEAKARARAKINKRKNSIFLKFTRKFVLIYLIIAMAFSGVLIYSDLLPKIHLLSVIGVITVVTLFIYFPMTSWRFKTSRRIIAFFLSIVFGVVYSFGGIYVYKTINFISNVTNVGTGSSAIRKSVDIEKNSYNIYLTGLDTVGNIDQKSRSDVNMIATINPKTHTVLLTSIPRDYYIPAGPNLIYKDKLTHTGIYGAKATINAIERMTGLDMNYYVKVNYSTFLKVVDSLGGIDINSAFDFKEKKLNDKYTHFKKGYNHVNGQEALAFVRARYQFKDGDLERNRNQQRALEAIIRKLSSSRGLLLNYGNIVSSLGNTIETNLTAQDIAVLVRTQLEEMSKWKIIRQGIDGEISPTLMPCYAMNGALASVVLPDKKSVEKCVLKIEQVMNEN